MTHPLGYDPDPSTRGEGSSTGRRRRESLSVPPDDSPRKRICRARFTGAEQLGEESPLNCLPQTLPLLPARTPSVTLRIPHSPAPQAIPRIRLLVGGGRPRKAKRGGGGTDVAPRASRSRATRSRRTSATPTTLESIAAESHAIKAEVTRLGLVLRDVTADGNCLFRALGDQVWGEQGRHAEVRTLVCNYLDSAHAELGDFVAGFLSAGEDYSAYVSRMRGLGVYGSHIELLAATKVFKRSIRIILSQTSYTVDYAEGGEEDSTVTGKRRASRRTRATTKEVEAHEPPPEPVQTNGTPIPPPLPGCSLIWLALFAEAEHYESVRKGGSGGPAEVPDSLAVPHTRDVSEAARRERGEVIEGDVKTKEGKPAKVDSRLTQVLASLPAGHGITSVRAAGVLARTKGDVAAAVEILLEDIQAEAEATTSDTSGTSATSATDEVSDSVSTASAADHVDAMLTADPSEASEPPDSTGRVTRSRASRTSSNVDVNAYREYPSSPSSTEASSPNTSTPPTSPLSHASEVDNEEKEASGPATRTRARDQVRGSGRGRQGRGRTRSSKM